MSDDPAKILKVLIVAPKAPPFGGQAVQAARLVENFALEPGIQVDLQPINPEFFPALQKVKFLRTFLTESKYMFDLFRRIGKYDVIHIFSASYFSFLLSPSPAMLVSKLFGKQTILNYRSGEARDHLSRWKTAVPLIKKFDRVVAPSGYLVDVFAEFGIGAQAVYNFVDTEKFRFRKRKPLRPVFLSNRNFEPLYNVACTLRAFALVQKRFPDAELIVAGGGSQRSLLEDLAAELKLNNISFPGKIPPSEMPALYERADIYLNSPNIDNMPNSVIEAYASGTPVISTNAGGIPYIVENEKTGLLVDVNDHEALAKAAIRVLEDEKLAQNLIEKGRKMLDKFSWTNARDEWLRIYRELATGVTKEGS